MKPLTTLMTTALLLRAGFPQGAPTTGQVQAVEIVRTIVNAAQRAPREEERKAAPIVSSASITAIPGSTTLQLVLFPGYLKRDLSPKSTPSVSSQIEISDDGSVKVRISKPTGFSSASPDDISALENVTTRAKTVLLNSDIGFSHYTFTRVPIGTGKEIFIRQLSNYLRRQQATPCVVTASESGIEITAASDRQKLFPTRILLSGKNIVGIKSSLNPDFPAPQCSIMGSTLDFLESWKDLQNRFRPQVPGTQPK